MRLHLERLVELEYVVTYREGPGGKYVYELAYEVDAQESRAQVAGLMDVGALKALMGEATTVKSRGLAPEVAGRLRGDETAAEPASKRVGVDLRSDGSEMHCSAELPKILSYTQKQAVGAASSLAAGV